MNELSTYLIISDTHDAIESLPKIKNVIKELDVSTMIHLGDYTSPFTLTEILKLGDVDFIGLLGNNDGDKVKLMEIGQGKLNEQPLELRIGNYEAVAIHGFKTPDLTKKVVYALVSSNYYNIVLYGHTHQYDLRVSNKVLIMNPGTLAGYLSGRKSYGVINLRLRVAEVRELESNTVLARVNLPD